MWEHELVERLSAAKNGDGDCKTIIDAYAQLTGKTVATLYRIARKNGYCSGRSRRRDAGECTLTDMQIDFICAQIHTTGRELKGPITPVAKALRDAEKNGIIAPGSISAERVTAILRERGKSAAALKAPEPHIHMRSLHPNHVHVIDASVCIQYYLKGRKGLRMMREDKFYKNKWENFGKVKEKLIRYVLADHFSHCLFVKYYYTGGESQENLFDFILSAWGPKGPIAEKFPLRGVPFFVLWDAGAANTARAMKAFFSRLEIQTPDALPHNPRRQGSAEVAQNLIERWFESGLRIEPAHTVEQLNEWALDWCAWYNAAKIHSRHGMTRTDCWLKFIRAEHIRDMPERDVMQYMYANPAEERLVRGDYTITFRGADYNLKHIEGLLPNHSKVSVILRPYQRPDLGVVFAEKEYLVSPVGTVSGGFSADAAVIGQEFKRMPDSPAQTAKKSADNLAYGETKGRDAVPFDGLRMFGHHADDVQRTYIPRLGRPIEVGSTDFDQHIPIMTFFAKLRAAGVTIDADLNMAVRNAYGTTIGGRETQRLLDLAADRGTLTPQDIEEDGHVTAQRVAI